MRMTLMGTGTSHGIPVIACGCAVCASADPRDKRNRCSAYVEQRDGDRTVHVVIDTGPEFRIQALRFGVTALDAVLITHAHADHLDGLDDLRVFSHTKSSDRKNESPGNGLPIYANAPAIKDTRDRFNYIFRDTQIGGGKPKLDLIDCAAYTGDRPLVIGGLTIVPIPMMHGALETAGWLLSCAGEDGQLRSIAYLTDCSSIPDRSFAVLTTYGGTIDHLVIDGLRETPHSTHFSYLQAMEAASRIGARHVWLTHICHNMNHAGITAYCQAHSADFPALARIVASGGSVLPAYDGLVLETRAERM